MLPEVIMQKLNLYIRLRGCKRYYMAHADEGQGSVVIEGHCLQDAMKIHSI